MSHAPKTIDEIVTAQAYIHAKLRAFELDQVTQGFSETRSEQGLGRAVRGAIQRGALKAAGAFAFKTVDGKRTGPYDWYVKNVAGQIEAERADVAAFEDAHGETFTRDLYHRIRDAPEESVPTYKATQTVFRKLERDLENERAKLSKNPITKAIRHTKAWVTYGDRELKGIAIAAGLAVGAGLMVPVHRINEWNDHHRPIAHVKYDHINVHPMTEMAIAAHELEMYLHETWNRAGDSESGTAHWVVKEYQDFIKKNDYNKRHTMDDGGSDWKKPVLDLFEEGRADTTNYLAPIVQPVGLIARGSGEIAKSWNHSSHNNTHVETYSCGTSKQPRTCTRVVCDSTDHNFTLDHAQLVKGAILLRDGAASAAAVCSPEPAAGKLSLAVYRQFLIGPQDLSVVTRSLGEERVKEELDLSNQWSRSVMITQHDAMLGGIGALASSPTPQQLVSEAGSYPTRFHNNNPFCGPPLAYPNGWSVHERAMEQAGHVTRPYTMIQDARNEFSSAFAKTEDAMKRIDATNEKGVTHDALRDLANLAWETHNANYEGESWHPTHGTRLFLEWLAFIGIAGAAFGGGIGLLNKYRETKFVRKLYENDVEPELVNPYSTSSRRRAYTFDNRI